jgi:hypothetical protein
LKAGEPGGEPPIEDVDVIIDSDADYHSPSQAAWVGSVCRELDVTLGRRSGKTFGSRMWLTGLHPRGNTYPWGAVYVPDGRFWYTAPTLRPACKDFYRGLKRTLGRLVIAANDSDLSLVLFNHATIECKSLEQPDNLLGVGLDGLITDEKGVVSEHAAMTVLAPMLTDPPERLLPNGEPCLRRWLRIGTPRGKKHWTYREHCDGLADPGGKRGRAAFQFPTTARPGMAAEVERMRRRLPTNVFKQEYLAEFLESGASYFRLIDEAHDGLPVPEKRDPAARYACGLDFGHADDYTVLVVVQASPRPMRVVFMLRFDPMPWPLTKARALEVFRAWNADAIIDATPSGAPSEVITASFKPEWTRITGFDFREGGGREDLLANLAIMLETEELRLPGTKDKPVYPMLKAELEGFQYEVLPSGRARAQKGRGLNDDCCMALGLAAWRAKHMGGGYASRKTF